MPIDTNGHAEGSGSLAGRGMGNKSPPSIAHDPAKPVRAWPLGWHLYLFALALIAPLLGFGLFAASRLGDADRVAGEEQARGTARMALGPSTAS